MAPVTAFGPDGSLDGDNPDIVSQIVDVNASQPWCSDRATAGDDPGRRPVRAGSGSPDCLPTGRLFAELVRDDVPKARKTSSR